MFSWAIRIVAYVLAAAALIRLIMTTETFKFDPIFVASLNNLRDILELGLLFDKILVPLVHLGLDQIREVLRGYDLQLPELQPHWQQLFVLMWLHVAATARGLILWIEGIGELSAPSRLGIAFAVTLPFCVGAGLLPMGSGAVLVAFGSWTALFAASGVINRRWTDAAGSSALSASYVIIGIASSLIALKGPNPIFLLALGSAISVICFLILRTRYFGRSRYSAGGAAVFSMAFGIPVVFAGLPEGAPLVLTALITITAINNIFTGLVRDTPLSERLSNTMTLAGLDIFAAMALAFAAVVLFTIP
jgi:hypothetical protein